MRIKIIFFFSAIIFLVCISDTSAAGGSNFAIRSDRHTKMVLQDAFAATGVRNKAYRLSTELSDTRYSLTGNASEIFTVLSVLEKRVGNEMLMEKIRDKLPAMSGEHLHMAASLSERIANDQGAKTDIAFLLLTTLIIFS